MPSHHSVEQDAPKPHDTLGDEGGSTVSWLASAWSREDIVEEFDYVVEDVDKLTEIWMACRWTAPEELADEDVLCDLFGGDPEDFDTSVVYWRATAETPGAHRYWTVDP